MLGQCFSRLIIMKLLKSVLKRCCVTAEYPEIQTIQNRTFSDFSGLIIAMAIFFANTIEGANEPQKQEKTLSFSQDTVLIQKILALIDLKKVASRCKAGKDIEKQMMEINNQSKTGHLELEDKIKSMEQDKTSDFDNRKIEEMQLILYDMVRTKRYQINEAYKKAISELESVIKGVVKSISIRDGIGMVIESDAVVYASDNCRDITEDVIREVDARCQSIKVEMKE
ncbi:MAG: OmpH family outer membrane protein [Holosporaceae bacterium]|jgi:Skp family chaperone for outer membrane proteins|nr:OmpH family outer membrane protein [Holosporaceae bacterium]